MTHGRTAKTRADPRRKKSSSLLTRFSGEHEKSLESRVATMEAGLATLGARIKQMQEEIDCVSGTMPAQMQEVLDSIGKKHPGPDKKVDDTELELNRNNLAVWLEQHWPRIVKALLAASKPSGTPREVAAVLRPIAAAREIRPAWQKAIVGHPAMLLEFLRSERFRVKPPKKTVVDALALYHSEQRDRAANRLPTRQIANAMAGVPKVKWRTSLDKCTNKPSKLNIGYNTAAYYRRMFDLSEQST